MATKIKQITDKTGLDGLLFGNWMARFGANNMKTYMSGLLIVLALTSFPVSASSDKGREADTIDTEELKSTEQDAIKVYGEIDGAMYIIDENAPEAIPTFDESDTTVFVKVEQMPEFPNGNQALLAYLAEKIKYPIVTGELRGGKEICEFIVNKDGSICNVHASQSSADSLLTKELLRAIQQMPHWIPGKHKGHVVRVKYVVPVNFT